MSDWISAIAQALAKVAGATEQGLENAGQKIPMREEAIRAKARVSKARSEGTEEKVIQNREIRKWKNVFEIEKDKFSLIQEGAVKNKIENIVKASLVIYDIEIRTKTDRYYACIRYVDNDDCQTFVEMPGKKV